jgi:hypothetical protein
MKRSQAWIVPALCLIAPGVLSGCHKQESPSPQKASLPSTVTPEQMDQALAQVNNDPKLSPQQKVETANMLRSHLHVAPAPGARP